MTKLVTFTFDDGMSKNWELLLNILNQEKIKATFFVIGETITSSVEGITAEDYMTEALAEEIFFKTLCAVNEELPLNLFVSSDDRAYKQKFINGLNNKINVITCDDDVDPSLKIYQDFLILANSDHIYMCSKYSSFAAIASLINNIPLCTFYKPEESTLVRNKVKFRRLRRLLNRRTLTTTVRAL